MLVYVPHTTAGVTINEKIDPCSSRDLEAAFEQVVGDDWGWRHDDEDGPNGPSHGRASVIEPAGADPAARRRARARPYQAIFLCEFDGPSTRTVYVTPLG